MNMYTMMIHRKSLPGSMYKSWYKMTFIRKTKWIWVYHSPRFQFLGKFGVTASRCFSWSENYSWSGYAGANNTLWRGFTIYEMQDLAILLWLLMQYERFCLLWTSLRFKISSRECVDPVFCFCSLLVERGNISCDDFKQDVYFGTVNSSKLGPWNVLFCLFFLLLLQFSISLFVCVSLYLLTPSLRSPFSVDVIYL